MKSQLTTMALTAAAFVITLLPANRAQAQFSFTTIDDPLSVEGSAAYGIESNNIVGAYWDGSGQQNGFLYNGSSWTTLDAPSGVSGFAATDISGDNGSGFYSDSSGVQHDFVYDISAGSYTTVDDPLGANGTTLNGTNGDNAVGAYSDSSDINMPLK